MKKLLFLLACVLLTSCSDGIKSSEVEFLQTDEDIYVYYKGKLYDGMVYHEGDDYNDRYELIAKNGKIKTISLFDGNGNKYFETTREGEKIFYDDKGKVVPKELLGRCAAYYRVDVRGDAFNRDLREQKYSGELPSDE